MKTGRTGNLAVIVPDITNPFFVAIVRRIEEIAAAAGYQPILVDSAESAEREAARLRALVGHMTDGLIILPVTDRLDIHGAPGRWPPTATGCCALTCAAPGGVPRRARAT